MHAHGLFKLLSLKFNGVEDDMIVMGDGTQTNPIPIDADTLGGKSSDEFASADALVSANQQIIQLAEHAQSVDFYTSSYHPWGVIAIASGTTAQASGEALHPGVRSMSSSASENSGYGYLISSGSILLAGGEKTTVCFKTATTLTGVTRRIGFHDSTDANAPTDGVYALIASGVLSGKTVNSGTASTTSTNYSLAPDTWYRLKIELNSAGTAATFTLYADNSTTILWADTLSANIPTGTNRFTGHGDMCIYSGTSAIALGYIDYIDIYIPAARRVL